ncbi:aspartate aminotransferase family protein [Blastochloris viridis]|uniref:Glutamate-1-semialdehyde 2,1-aminomutase n=1 Tax=Blastochloris viridis TaxID=1079 RepID=A0A0H5BBU1_BLAVI|nr:aminotransferase class III-fold pyridoxal phosphate-dependent enzyme [Blastochloris viridis]ALK08145.1 Beta-phenylalanine transaminase [Blastochloris viridis]BAR98589.1 glutamate-1-semialdehyde aminotransferase [Blastochloris viridis]CUU44067.1 Glutamate-1-semialdehyde 2,1-aminomutase [Blastochloris viridis]
MAEPLPLARARADYVAANPNSRAYRDRAAAFLPGGGTRSSYHFSPFPLVLAAGEGDVVTDLDGHRRLDFNANFGVTVHGHGFRPIVDAIRRQAETALCFAAPSPGEAELAELLQRRVPSLRAIRFASSGTEAMMVAITAARAFTGRRRLAKLHGGYHGSSEFGAVGGPGTAPGAASGGGAVVVLPAAEPDAVLAAVAAQAGELAAVVVEPIQGAAGLIAVDRDLLRRLRDLTARHGILLIFDEVMLFRVAFGGVQSRLGIEPDLTVLGKLIGGGLPVGAVGGRADVMDVFNPYRADWVRLAGTYNGNPMSMAAGVACLAALQPDDFVRMDDLAADLVARAGALLRQRRIPASIAQAGAFFCLHALPAPARSHAELQRQDRVLFDTLHLGLINAGVLLTPAGLGCVSTRTTAADIDRFVAGFDDALRRYLN